MNFLTAEARKEGRTPLLINLDETSVPFTAGRRHGNMIGPKPKTMCSAAERPTITVSKKTLRAHFTHVGVICDDPAVQPLLPQVLIFNKMQITPTRAKRLESSLAPNVRIVVKKSAWSDAEVHGAILALIGRVMESFPTRRAIVIQDTASIHLDHVAWSRAWAAGVWSCLVPPSCTWLVQPLDTHCFARYKAELETRAADAFRELGREPKAEDIATVVGSVVRTVMQGTLWKEAFRQTGWADEQRHVSPFVRDHIKFCPSVTPVGHAMPTEETLSAAMPTTRRALPEVYLAPWASEAVETSAVATAAPPPPAAVARADGSIADRRLRRRLTSAASTETHSSETMSSTVTAP